MVSAVESGFVPASKVMDLNVQENWDIRLRFGENPVQLHLKLLTVPDSEPVAGAEIELFPDDGEDNGYFRELRILMVGLIF